MIASSAHGSSGVAPHRRPRMLARLMAVSPRLSFRAVLLGSLLCGVLAAADDARAPGLNLEPIEFSGSAAPQADPTASAPAGSSSWNFAAFSRDSTLLATIGQGEGEGTQADIVIWDVAAAKIICKFTRPGRIRSAAFSPDHRLIAIGPSGPQFGVSLFDTTSGELKVSVPGPAAQANCLAWSADGSRLALGSTVDKTVREWDVARKRFVKAHELTLTQVMAVAYGGDGMLLAVGSPARERVVLHVQDVVANTPLTVLTGHKEMIESAQFTSDATRVVSAGWDATVRIWDVTKGEPIGELKGHKKGINSVSQSADGNRIASASSREFKLWDGEKKELLADLGAENEGARLVAMSPSGKWMVSILSDGTAHLWDVEAKSEKTTLNRNPAAVATTAADSPDGAERPEAPPATDAPEPEAIQSLSYSRDGRWLAIAREDGRISIRTAADGKVHRELEAFSDVASSVAFSPDSQLLASGSFDKMIKIWKVESGELVAELTGHGNWIFGVAFSPDGQTLASASYDKTVKLWSVAEAKELVTLTGHTAGVRAVAFTRDGKHLVSGGSDRTAIVWNLQTRQPVATLKGHTAAIRDIACSPDGSTIATASEDATIRLWKTADWTERAIARGADGVMFWCVAYSPQGRTLAGGAFDGAIKLFDPTDGKERSTLTGPTDAVTAVTFAPDTHEIVASSIDKSFRRFIARKPNPANEPGETTTTELKPSEAITALNAATLKVEQPVSSLAYDKTGQQLLVGAGGYRIAGSVQLWDTVKHAKKWQSAPFRFGVPAVAFSPTGQQLAVGTFTDNFLRIYNVADGEKTKELRGHRSKIHGVAYAPNGKYFATASLDRDIKLWDAAMNREIRTLVGHKDYVFSIEFSPDSKQLLSASADETARLWNVDTGKSLRELTGHGSMIQQAQFSRDGSRIATASADGTSRIYDTATGDYLLTLRGHRNKIESVSFSPDGRLIATGSVDRTVRLWDASCGAELLKLAQDATVRAVRFSPDGRQLASGGDDKTVKLWDVAAFGPP